MNIPNSLPNNDLTSDRLEGAQEEEQALGLGLEDSVILEIIGKRIENGISFYNKELDLDRVRQENQDRWLNKNLEVGGKSMLYKFQTPYRDNRIFLSVETLAPNLTTKTPSPVITAGADSDVARQLAEDYGHVLLEKARVLNVKGALQMAIRHLLIGYRIGWVKVEWDFNAGVLTENGELTGDCKVSSIRPQKIIVDAETSDLNDISLLAQNMRKSAEDLLSLFPLKKKEIYQLAHINEGKETKKGLGTMIDYYEVWFSYFDNGVKKEGIAWKCKDILFGSGKNPYYVYDDPKRNNYFSRPMKPFIPFTYLRLGRWIYDDTSLTEQAATLQDVLEKRGRQIVESADAANSTKVFNTIMVNAKDIQKYNGDPSQSIAARGDVREAFKREAPPQLPSYVLTDKIDARNEIDNIFGVHAPLRGEATTSPTLGQEVMSQRSDLGRMGPLLEVLEAGSTQVYRWMTQLYKVFGDETHFVPYTGDTGTTSHIEFNKHKIGDGLLIGIESGSSMPNDKESDRREAIELAKLGGRIDPLSFAQKLHLPNPREFAKRLVYFLWTPDKYMSEVLGMGEGDQNQAQAGAVIERIKQGENVPPQVNPTKEYIAMFNQYIQSPEFKTLDPEVQQLMIEHIKATMAGAQGSLNNSGNPAPPAPPAQPQGFLQALTSRFGGQKPSEGGSL